MDKEKVLIVLINYCNYEDTVKCVDSIKLLKYSNYEVLIVDNQSPNDSVEQLKKIENPKVKIIISEKNGGFAYGNNLGIQYAIANKFDYVLLLNNDTIVDEFFLSEMVKTYKNNDKDFVLTSRIMYGDEPDTVWYDGGNIDWNNLRAIHYGINKKYDGKSLLNIIDVNFASGCCMMIPIKIIKAIDMLPEDYFMYYEDLDYCIHIRDLGYKIRYNPKAIIYHFVSKAGGGKNSPFVIEWTNRSRRLFYKKYKSHIRISKRFLIFVWCEIRSVFCIVCSQNRISGIKAYIKSLKKAG